MSVLPRLCMVSLCPGLLWLLLPCFQVMGHHNANLDPLGISCVNFDEAPVATGYQHVGEKCFLSPSQLCRTSLMSLFCVIVALPNPLPHPTLPLSLSLFCPSFFSSFHLSPLHPHSHFHLHLLPSWVLLHSLPRLPSFLHTPPDGCIVSCRSGVTMSLSWTLWGSWMPIWTRASPPTLLRLRINSVRSYEAWRPPRLVSKHRAGPWTSGPGRRDWAERICRPALDRCGLARRRREKKSWFCFGGSAELGLPFWNGSLWLAHCTLCSFFTSC